MPWDWIQILKSLPNHQKEIPTSAKTFSEMSLIPMLSRGINAHGFKTPSTVQQKVLPCICSGKNVVYQASSGSGKTAGE